MQKKRKKRKRKQEHQELQVLELLEKQAQVKEKAKDQVLVQLIQDTITHFKNNKKIKQLPRKQ